MLFERGLGSVAGGFSKPRRKTKQRRYFVAVLLGAKAVASDSTPKSKKKVSTI